MTALGIDISEHNPGLIIPTDGSVDYVIARASLAETKKDTLYRSFHDQCKAAKIPFAAYHFVYPRLPGSSYDAQAQNFHSVVGDTSIPVMLDVETDNTTHPSLADAVGVHRALVAIGYRIPLIYLPRWYWNGALGSAPIPAELGDLMSSNYGSNTPHLLADGYRTRGGDGGSGWASYGGRPVGIWQFTDFRNDNTHPNTVPGIKKSVSDTSAAVLTAVATLAAKVTDLADAVAQIQTASGGGPSTITLTGTSTPSAP